MDGAPLKPACYLRKPMSDAETTPYLDRLLALYAEKLKRFRLSLTLLLVATIAFFFLIFFPYMTLVGNQKDCQAKQGQCTQLEQSQLEDRFSEVTTSWGNIPISTAEVVIFFPAGVACGFIAVTAQLQGLLRLRQAISQQVNSLESPIDVTLIAPLLIDPKQSFLDQIPGGLTLLFPPLVVVYSVRLLLGRLPELKDKLPYIQSLSFYQKIYILSILLVMYGLLKTVFNVLQALLSERKSS